MKKRFVLLTAAVATASALVAGAPASLACGTATGPGDREILGTTPLGAHRVGAFADPSSQSGYAGFSNSSGWAEVGGNATDGLHVYVSGTGAAGTGSIGVRVGPDPVTCVESDQLPQG